MIGKAARIVIDSPILAVLGVVVLVAMGIRGYRKLPIDAVPDVTNVQVQVLSSAPGLSPVEVERLVTQPVELAMTGIPRVQTVRSISRAGVSAVTLVFDDDMDLEQARQLVSQRLPSAREAIPMGAGRPELGPLTTGLGEVYHFTVTWPGHTAAEVRTLLEWDIAYRLRSVPGVVEVNPWGGDERQLEVRLRPRDLLISGISPATVESTLLAGGQSASAGSLERREEGTFVRLDATFRKASDVEGLVVNAGVADEGGKPRTPVFVRDVADVVDGKAPRFSAATADGKGETVYAMVQMVAGGNAHDVVKRVKLRLAEIAPSLPAGVQVEPFYDRAAFVDEVLGTVKKSLLEGGLVVALVLLLMLGDLRAGLLVASVIPLSMLGAFLLMQQTGVSGNLLSLGAIDFGLVVDGAVVIVEGALAAMATRKLSGRDAMGTVAGEVGRPVTMAVVIIAIVYLPVLLLEGVEGKLFRPMALTVLFAIGTALVLTFTWIPAMGGLVLKRAHTSEPWLARKLGSLYEPVAAFVTPRWKLASVGLLALLLIGSVVAAGRGAEFVPRLEEGDLAIQITRPPSVSLEEAIRGTTAVEQALAQFPEVERVVSRTGSPDVATDVMGVEQSDVMVMLKPRSEWVTADDAAGFAEVFEPVLSKALPGAAFGFTQPIEMRVDELIGGVRSDVGVKIFGDDLAVLRRAADKISAVIAATPGAADVRAEPISGLSMLTLRPDPVKMGRMGVTPEQIERFIESLRIGRPVGKLIQGERRFDVMMRMAEVPAGDPEPMAQLRVPLGDGRFVLLGDVVDINEQSGPAQVSREQARRRVVVEANVRGRDLASFVQELQSRIRQVELPPGYFIEYGGEYENLARATERLALIVPATLLAILVLLYLAFGALRPALLIFINVPAAATGGVFALALRGLELSISAAVGFLALFGVATLNGVVLLAAARQRQLAGEDRLSASTHAARERLRPVITTALVAALGFVPMALATGTGAEVQRPLATVVIGGLVTATLATLLGLPALFARFGGELRSRED
ncbi:MAG: CusA/CzcA family heavy metal efflux RND transporter [Polyangiaceae bacterium]